MQRRSPNRAKCGADAAESLAELVAGLREYSPGSVEAWADAHRGLLEAFIAEREREGDEVRTTEIFVAREERAAWGRVRDDELPYVNENNFYVSIGPERYRADFGIDP